MKKTTEQKGSVRTVRELSKTIDPAVEKLRNPLAPPKGFSVNTGSSSLPYYELGGRGFERLMLNILIAQGKTARFFGDSGQRDYEVDIVVEVNDKYELYQCKNLKEQPNIKQINDTIQKFQKEWLEEKQLPERTKYIYCCPHSFSDIKVGEPWENLKNDFKEQTGVSVELFTLDELNQHLKRLPDIVTDIFSEAYAEFFCSEKTWQSGPWSRITSEINEQRHQVIHRFLELHNKKRIYLDAEVQDWFTGQIYNEKVLLLRGLPGSGKTTTALELINSLTTPRCHIQFS